MLITLTVGFSIVTVRLCCLCCLRRAILALLLINFLFLLFCCLDFCCLVVIVFICVVACCVYIDLLVCYVFGFDLMVGRCCLLFCVATCADCSGFCCLYVVCVFGFGLLLFTGCYVCCWFHDFGVFAFVVPCSCLLFVLFIWFCVVVFIVTVVVYRLLLDELLVGFYGYCYFDWLFTW